MLVNGSHKFTEFQGTDGDILSNANGLTLLAKGNYTLEIAPTAAGTGYWGFKAATVDAGKTLTINTDGTIDNVKVHTAVTLAGGGRLVVAGKGLTPVGATWALSEGSTLEEKLTTPADAKTKFWKSGTAQTILFGAAADGRLPRLVLNASHDAFVGTVGVLAFAANKGVVEIAKGAEFNITATTAATFTSGGTLIKDGEGALIFKTEAPGTNASFEARKGLLHFDNIALSSNVKSLDVAGGVVSIDKDGAVTGPVTVTAGKLETKALDTFTDLNISGGTATFGGLTEALATANISGGSATFNNNAASLATIGVTGTGKATFGGTVKIAGGNLTVDGAGAAATFNAAATLDDSKLNEGKIVVASGNTLTIASTKILNSAANKNNYAALVLKNGATVASAGTLDLTGEKKWVVAEQGSKITTTAAKFDKLELALKDGKVAAGDTFLTVKGVDTVTKMAIAMANADASTLVYTLKSGEKVAALVSATDSLPAGFSATFEGIGNPNIAKFLDASVDVAAKKVYIVRNATKVPSGGIPDDHSGAGDDKTPASEDIKPAATGSVTPAADGTLTAAKVDLKGTVTEVKDAAALTAVGVTAKVVDGAVVLDGTPKDAGTFKISVVLDGKTTDVTVEIKEAAAKPATLVDPTKAKTEWTVVYKGSKAAPTFEMWFPVTGFEKKTDMVETPFATIGDKEFKGVLVAGEGKSAGTQWVKFSGNVPADATLKSVKYRVGTVPYVHTLKDGVKLADTKFTNSTTDTPATPAHKSSSGGCDAGFGVLALAAAAAVVLRKKN